MELLRILESPRIIETLNLLYYSSKSKSELRKTLNVSKSHIAQILSKIVNLGLAEKAGEKYVLTNKGYVILNAYELLRGYDEFLSKVDVNDFTFEDLPDHLVERLYQLSKARIVEKDETFKLHEEFVSAVLRAKFVRGYTNIFFPEHVSLFSGVADEKESIEIVVSREVMREILANHREELRQGLLKPNVKFYVAKRAYKFSFIVTDREMILFLYLKNGFFDYRRELICESDQCLDWCNNLYSHVVKNSIRVFEGADLDRFI